MPTIHPSSVIDRGAELADDVVIGPLCYVGPSARIGAGTRLMSHVCVMGRTTLGKNNTVWPQATLGAAPQDLKFKGEDSELVIGDNNLIRESVTIHIGTENGGGITRIGSNNFLMVNVHVAHDCVIGDHILIANGVGLSGHVHMHDHSSIAGHAALHHFVSVGKYAYVGGLSRVVHDVPPFMICEGSPSEVRSVNTIGLLRHGFTDDDVKALKDAYRRVYRNTTDESAGPLSITQRLDALDAKYPGNPHVHDLVTFLRNTASATHGRYLESLRKDKRLRRTQS